jgi:hypothetical protein
MQEGHPVLQHEPEALFTFTADSPQLYLLWLHQIGTSTTCTAHMRQQTTCLPYWLRTGDNI